jgi:3-deoxy-D-manno-octulosonic-acid transferase
MIRGWMKQILNDYAILGMQSESDRHRIESIGAISRKVTVFGNLKFDAVFGKRALEPALSRALRICQPLWIAASTMPGEEELILDAYRELRKRHPRLTLLIAPRHPERFDVVEGLIRSRGLDCVRRSTILTVGAVSDRALFQGERDMSESERKARGRRPRPQSEVFLLDSIGELAATFEFAAIVFMGGTLVPRGGHNILEPAMFAKPIVFGPHMENFREIAASFLKEQAAVQVRDEGELVAELDRLLSDDRSSAELGANARRLIDVNAGATEKVIAALQPVGVGGASR